MQLIFRGGCYARLSRHQQRWVTYHRVERLVLRLEAESSAAQSTCVTTLNRKMRASGDNQ